MTRTPTGIRICRRQIFLDCRGAGIPSVVHTARGLSPLTLSDAQRAGAAGPARRVLARLDGVLAAAKWQADGVH